MKSLFTALLGGVFAIAATPEAKAEASGFINVSIGKACWVEGYTNAAATWTVKIRNGDSVALVLEGSGTNFAPMTVTQGSRRFDVTGGVVAEVSADYGGPMDVRLKFGNHTIASDSGDPALFHTVIGGEDGADDDWQDLILNVTCLHHAG